MATGSILLVDDETKILNALAQALRGEGHEVVATTSAREAQRLLVAAHVRSAGRRQPDAGADRAGPDSRAARQRPPSERPQIVMMTAHATVESAIEAMKLGAFDYLQKPFESTSCSSSPAARSITSGCAPSIATSSASATPSSTTTASSAAAGDAGGDPTAEVVAKSKSTVLITGETGTGKELVARAIHYRSAQREMPLIKVNCAAIPETLLESELFGHVRGAFTGATTSKTGKFALADGGTIFLDEIGDDEPGAAGQAAARAAGARVRAARDRSAARRSTCA